MKTLLVLQRPALERLIAELNRSIDYYKREFGEARVDRILLCGGTAATKNVRDFLATNLQIKCETFDPLKIGNLYKRGVTAEQEIGFRLVGAIGLLCDAMVVDLMPHELRARRQAATDVKIVAVLAIRLDSGAAGHLGACWRSLPVRPTRGEAKRTGAGEGRRTQTYFDLQTQYNDNNDKSKGRSGHRRGQAADRPDR